MSRGSSPLARGLPHRPDGAHRHQIGSSPLARGLLVAIATFFGEGRIIPARAGFTSTTDWRTAASGDHPRSRGVYRPPQAGHRRAGGSSPLARGLHLPYGDPHDYARIIPARAGFTCVSGTRR